MRYWRKLMRQDGATRRARKPLKTAPRSSRWQLRLAGGLGLAAALAALIAAPARDAPSIAPIRFRNVASSAGIDFVLENSATPEKQLIETMPGGVVAFDYVGRAEPVDARHRRDHDGVTSREQRGGRCVAQPVDLVVDRRVLLDVGVRPGDVRLGLVVVV